MGQTRLASAEAGEAFVTLQQPARLAQTARETRQELKEEEEEEEEEERSLDREEEEEAVRASQPAFLLGPPPICSISCSFFLTFKAEANLWSHSVYFTRSVSVVSPSSVCGGPLAHPHGSDGSRSRRASLHLFSTFSVPRPSLCICI